MTLHSNTSAAQCKRLLSALRNAGSYGISTLEARNMLDILHPGGRIKNLRERKYEIVTVWSLEHTNEGKHRVARYILIAEPF